VTGFVAGFVAGLWLVCGWFVAGGGAELRAVVGCTRLRSSVRERWVRDKVIGL